MRAIPTLNLQLMLKVASVKDIVCRILEAESDERLQGSSQPLQVSCCSPTCSPEALGSSTQSTGVECQHHVWMKEAAETTPESKAKL